MRAKKSYSGKFVIRMTPQLHEELHYESERSGNSLNELCLNYLQNGLLLDRTIRDDFPELLLKLKTKFKESLIGVVLFGSQARGDAHDNSDTDVLVALDEKIPIVRDLYKETEDSPFSIHFTRFPNLPEDAGSIWLESAIDGKILYDQEDRLAIMLNRLRRKIAEGKVVRKVTHGQGYWVNL